MTVYSAKAPDIEFHRKLKNGALQSLVIIYWKPLKVWILGKTIIDRSKSK